MLAARNVGGLEVADEKARFVGLAQAILRDQGQGGKPARDDDAPLHEAALLVQPLAVPVRVGGADPQPHAVAADGRLGVFGRIDERAVAAHPSLFDAHATISLSQPDVRLNARPSVRGTQTAIVVGQGDGELHTDRDNRVRVQFHGNAAPAPATARLAPRGHGLELASGARGALGADAGLFVSAHAQPASTNDFETGTGNATVERKMQNDAVSDSASLSRMPANVVTYQVLRGRVASLRKQAAKSIP